MTKDINVLALVKGKERYIFLFDDDNRSEALRHLRPLCLEPGTELHVVRRGGAKPKDSADGSTSKKTHHVTPF